MDTILLLIFQLVVLLFSVVIHEVSHGYAAERLGDPTARLAGRLTLNPIPHLDLFGSILLPLLLFVTGSPILLGWAKPVPYNPLQLTKDYRYGPLKVALAGPLANAIVFFVFSMLVRFGGGWWDPFLSALFAFVAFFNLWLVLFNLIPIPPLDGSKLLALVLPARYVLMLEQMGMFGIVLIFFLLFSLSGPLVAVAGSVFTLVAGSDALLNLLRLLGG
ncbi:MAG: site-2 protease family protein [Candidatus Liptonbacteria bacterium]|nr:site-2 protease family protein [Candidatus Liptonbacteria bacterium]